jgi:hypothetical protein
MVADKVGVPESEIGEDMAGGHDLKNRQIGHGRHNVGEQL